MQFIYALIIFSLLAICCNSERQTETQNSFEGLIEYAYTYESDSLDLATLKSQRPFKGIMLFKGSKYKSVFVAKNKTETYIYDNDTGIAYDLTHKDSINCENYSVQNDTVFNFKIIDTNEKVLGHEVRILEFKSKYATNRFYFSTKFKVAPFKYDKHLAYNWNFYMKNTDGGIILKVEHVFKKFTMKGIASQFEVKEINPNEFKIDKNKLTTTCR